MKRQSAARAEFDDPETTGLVELGDVSDERVPTRRDKIGRSGPEG
jgi:hypothetical protein